MMIESISAEQLRALRLAAGLELSVLARQVSLSPAQLMQLENGLDSLFYTPAIGQQAARKVYLFLTGSGGAAPIAPGAALAARPQAAPSRAASRPALDAAIQPSRPAVAAASLQVDLYRPAA